MLRADTRSALTFVSFQWQQLRLCLEAFLSSYRTTWGKLAFIFQVHQHRRVTLDRDQWVFRRSIGPWRRPQQTDGIRHAGIFEQVVHPGAFDGTPGVHHHDIIGGFCNHAHVVGNHDRRRTRFFLCNFNDVQDLRLDGHVQCGGWLVGDQDLRVVRNRDGDDYALAHTPRKLVWKRFQAQFWLTDPDEFQQMRSLVKRDPLAHLLVGLDCFDQLCSDIENRSQCRERILEDHANVFAANFRHLLVVFRQQVFTVELH